MPLGGGWASFHVTRERTRSFSFSSIVPKTNILEYMEASVIESSYRPHIRRPFAMQQRAVAVAVAVADGSPARYSYVRSTYNPGVIGRLDRDSRAFFP